MNDQGNQTIATQESGKTSLQAAVTVQPPTPAEIATSLAKERTDLAVARTSLANERTLLAWIRTALAMISFGFTLSKLSDVLREVAFKGLLGRTRTISIKELAYFLVILGSVALLGAAFQHWRRMRELHFLGLPRRVGISLVVALCLAALGGFALTVMVLSL